MQKLTLHTPSLTEESLIYIGESFLENMDQIISDTKKKTIIITDENVFKLYGNKLKKHPVFILPAGEEAKSFKYLEKLLVFCQKNKLDRSSHLLAFGGGVVSDLVGLTASLYMRGIECSYLATTILAQADASVGGKTAINSVDIKNIFGTFKQPRRVFCDLSTLQTLSERQYYNGFAEIIKIAMIADKDFYKFLIKTADLSYKHLKREKLLEKIIYKAITLKHYFVEKDTKEKNIRMFLNFGHTLGHAYELNNNLLHGEAIALGIISALKLSEKILNIPDSIRRDFTAFISKTTLPVSLKADKEQILKTLLSDKKKKGDKIKFVLLEEIGKPIIKPFTLDEIKRLVNELP